MQTYGYEYMFALNNMEALGLLRRAEAINVFGSAGGGEQTPPAAHVPPFVHQEVLGP